MGAKDGGDLKRLIRQAIPEERDKPPLREGDWIRVSGLAMLCAREEVLCSRNDKVRLDSVDADLMMIFEHGNGLHWDLQNRILPQTKTIFGRWLCGACGVYHGGEEEWETPVEVVAEQDAQGKLHVFHESQILRPRICPNCGVEMTSDNSLYQEQWIKEPKFRLAGHPDGFLWLPDMPGPGILEVKSISPRGAYEVRNCAKLDHVTQAQCYMWMAGCQWGKIIYWDKGTVGMKGLIEHTVEYDEDHVEAMQALVGDIWSGVKGQGKLPGRICAKPNCKRAKACSSVEECFAEAD